MCSYHHHGRGRFLCLWTHIRAPYRDLKWISPQILLFWPCGSSSQAHSHDDNFVTRWMVNHEWKMAFQHSLSACMKTTLGKYPKFLRQCLRWFRTTWRSNFTDLFIERKVWHIQPWRVYAVYLASFFNFTLSYEVGLLFTAWLAFNRSPDVPIETRTAAVWALFLWISRPKLVKSLPPFFAKPQGSSLPSWIYHVRIFSFSDQALCHDHSLQKILGIPS